MTNKGQSLSRRRSGRGERAGCGGDVRWRAGESGGDPSLPQRAGGRDGPSLLGHAAAVERYQGRAGEGRAGLRRPRRRYRAGYVGRGLRPAGRERPVAGQSRPLPRPAHRWDDGGRVREGLARGDLRGDGHPVYAVEHALPARGDGRREVAGAWMWRRRC